MTTASTSNIPTTIEHTNPVVTVTPTDIVSLKVTNLVERYRNFAKASAENILQLAVTLAEANRTLSKDELSTFCREVEVNPKSSTYRKLTHIGLNATRFDNHLERLPTAWTTVYDLAKLSEQDFEKVATNDNFCPTMTAKSIAEIVGPSANQPAKRSVKVVEKTSSEMAVKPPIPALPDNVTLTSPRTMLLNFDGICETDVVEVYNHIKKMQVEKNFTFEISNGLREASEQRSIAV